MQNNVMEEGHSMIKLMEIWIALVLWPGSNVSEEYNSYMFAKCV